MSKKIDISGKRFGRLLAVKETKEKYNGQFKWLCQCDCGRKKIFAKKNLTNGMTKSCGCLQKDKASKANKKHGMYKTPTYKSWSAMITRCTNKNAPNYSNYGGRGITVCKRWEKFENFYSDMGVRPKGKTLDRIDNNLGYSPKNCKWSTVSQQNRNTRRNRLITYQGKTQTLAEWAEDKRIDYNKLYAKIYFKRCTVSEALSLRDINSGGI